MQDITPGMGSHDEEARSQSTPTASNRPPDTALTHRDSSLDVLEYAVNVYRTKVHLQPLPLFNLQGLSDRLAESSPFLRWSFLALCLNLAPPAPSAGQDLDAGQRYSRMSHQVVTRLAAEGTATLEVLEALCLLALSDMIVGKPARAWMTIGAASRLQAFRTLSRPEPDSIKEGAEHESRCYWSIFVLERVFAHHRGEFGESDNALKYPPSAPWPPPVHTQNTNSQAAGPSNLDEGLEDPGILAHCIEMISIWGDVCSSLRELRSGKAESPWMPNSIISQLSLRMHETEARFTSRHLLRNVALPGRSAFELLEHQEYWAPWALMEIAAHAIPSILNHPFIHLVTTHGDKRARGSRVYYQQTVDRALYNSGWVARLLRILDNLPFELTNPLIGHMVAGTATVLWFFQFARDSTVSHKAKEDLGTCEQFLARMSSRWPHIAQKVCLAVLESSSPDSTSLDTVQAQS
ncbi:hypothetical protein PV11_09978 [Exophiala sideris]|uniref:Transcription factor domain-containing protein n=1 Tax=Exophiala sideris TaxID=1016849 RepID=A0A0D1Y5U2_9EURO|nr:hypothetical protein PV11_09978 [Exophiala sideris]